MENRTSLGVIYFGMGLTLGVMGTMITLILVRPFLPLAAMPNLHSFLLYLPLIVGLGLGLRMRHIGTRENLRMIGTLKRSLGLSRKRSQQDSGGP